MADIAAWWYCVIRHLARDMWDSLPGPWWVKVLIIVVCQLIPTQVDEIILFAVIAWWRRRKARGGEDMADRYAGEWDHEPEDFYPGDEDEIEDEPEAGS